MRAQETLTDAKMAEEDQGDKLEKKNGEAPAAEAPADQGMPSPETAPTAAPESAAPEGEPSLEPSAELKQALDEAVKSFESAEEKKRKKAEEPPRPSEEELKLKMEILDLRRRVRELEAEVEKKVKEIKQNYDQGMMLKNQFDSYKVRVQREKADWFNYGHEPIIKDLLSVLDNFERALAHAERPEDFEAFKQGIQMIYRQFLKVLEGYGVKQLESRGQTFNPVLHEALAQAPNAEVPPCTILEEHNKGYLLKDRLLRPARVTISAGPVPGGESCPPAPGPEAEPATETEAEKVSNPPSQEDKKS